jgi:hypothetical protein
MIVAAAYPPSDMRSQQATNTSRQHAPMRHSHARRARRSKRGINHLRVTDPSLVTVGSVSA